MSALLDSDEKAVAGRAGVHRLVEEHSLDLGHQHLHYSWRAKDGGQGIVRDDEKDCGPALRRNAVGHGRVGVCARERLGVEARSGQVMARLGRSLEERPLLRAAVQSGRGR